MFDVVQGDDFDVTLADLPGAGYSWTAAPVPSGLTLVETQATTPAADVVGASQRKTMRFRADRAGDYELVFTYARPWEDAPAEWRTIAVHVHPPSPEEAT